MDLITMVLEAGKCPIPKHVMNEAAIIKTALKEQARRAAVQIGEAKAVEEM